MSKSDWLQLDIQYTCSTEQLEISMLQEDNIMLESSLNILQIKYTKNWNGQKQITWYNTKL